MARRGNARPTSPDMAVEPAQTMEQEAERLVTTVEAMPTKKAENEASRAGALRPAPPPLLERRPLNVPVPVSHAEGLRVVMHYGTCQRL
jgi:hypothetical protein